MAECGNWQLLHRQEASRWLYAYVPFLLDEIEAGRMDDERYARWVEAIRATGEVIRIRHARHVEEACGRLREDG